ncbi:hypothetical protein GNP44_19190 [Aliivibrio fischeri]|uniref:hypothetical protein n=1 Tax=Aliivibrio fischeri TaxID=668 RepID=UPI0012D8E029|nr:hypothetical protein [Aliivibrio fischeri]MUK32189.1 hypothetical protein [Aliivibrio fischeri]MUK67709.1 hypothetical protein [Aliivibrio fischeri]
MKKAIVILSILTVSGCTSTQNAKPESGFIHNTETTFQFGSSDNNIGAIQFVLDANEEVKSSLIVNFNELPFLTKFDLCEKTGFYDDLKSVTTDSNGELIPLYKEEKVNCTSEVIIQKDNGNDYLVSYNLNFLEGYNKAKVKGYDKLLPATVKRLTERRLVIDKNDNEPEITLKLAI